jgi:hypothetical protein
LQFASFWTQTWLPSHVKTPCVVLCRFLWSNTTGYVCMLMLPVIVPPLSGRKSLELAELNGTAAAIKAKTISSVVRRMVYPPDGDLAQVASRQPPSCLAPWQAGSLH